MLAHRYDDTIPKRAKLIWVERIIHSIVPTVRVDEDAFAAIKEADHFFGGLDSEGDRLILTEVSAAYSRPSFDLASDIVHGNRPINGTPGYSTTSIAKR
jgi:hypothetical protein